MDEEGRGATAQDFGFVLAGVIAVLYRQGHAANWHDPYMARDFDELLSAAETLRCNRVLQEQIVADSEIVAELNELASYLTGPDPDFKRVSIITQRLWRAVKPFSW